MIMYSVNDLMSILKWLDLDAIPVIAFGFLELFFQDG